MGTIDLSGFAAETEEAAERAAEKPIEQRTAHLPSPARAEAAAAHADLRALIADRKQMNFAHVPRFIHDMFRQRAVELGFTYPVEYLYHLMRQDGLDVPPTEVIQSRKRRG